MNERTQLLNELDTLLEYKELCTNEDEDDLVDARITQLLLLMAS